MLLPFFRKLSCIYQANMSWIQIVDNNEVKQIFNIARTLSVTLTFLETSKDNKAINPTCTCKRLFISRMTLWIELLHNYWTISFIHDCILIRPCEMVSENKSNIDSWYVSWYLAHHHVKNWTAVQKEVQLYKKRRYEPIGPLCVKVLSTLFNSTDCLFVEVLSLCRHLRFCSPWHRMSTVNTAVLVHVAHMFICSCLNTYSARSKILVTTG